MGTNKDNTTTRSGDSVVDEGPLDNALRLHIDKHYKEVKIVSDEQGGEILGIDRKQNGH